ncbi:MAG: Hsp70 family protein, partial [Hydrogenobaculum sp.]
IEARNRLDSLIYNLEKLLNEHKDKISQDLVQEAETEISKGKQALNSTDKNAIEEAYSKITDISNKIATSLYSSGQTPPPNDQNPPDDGFNARPV